MATTTHPYSRTGGRVAPPAINRAETLWWNYMRLSGILLVPLVFGHLFIVHLINSVAVINYEWVINTRWHFFGWRLYDAAMLWFAGVHGFRGFLYVLDDYIHAKRMSRI